MTPDIDDRTNCIHMLYTSRLTNNRRLDINDGSFGSVRSMSGLVFKVHHGHLKISQVALTQVPYFFHVCGTPTLVGWIYGICYIMCDI